MRGGGGSGVNMSGQASLLFLLVVVSGQLECTVQLSVASAAATIKSSVLKLTMAVSQLLSFSVIQVPQLLLLLLFFLFSIRTNVFYVFPNIVVRTRPLPSLSSHRRGRIRSVLEATATVRALTPRARPRSSGARACRALRCALSDCYLYFAVM